MCHYDTVSLLLCKVNQARHDLHPLLQQSMFDYNIETQDIFVLRMISHMYENNS